MSGPGAAQPQSLQQLEDEVRRQNAEIQQLKNPQAKPVAGTP